jgi:prepilin-type N-terminal cleavage/methylation domain-containing protein
MNVKRNQGFTLLEMMIATAVFTVVMGALYGMAVTLNRTERFQSANFDATQNVRGAIIKLMPLFQQASRQTITVGNGGQSLTFRIPVDTDGNGYAISNLNNSIEISGLYTLAVVATPSASGNTMKDRYQLTLTDPNGAVTILANNINPGAEVGTGVNGDWSLADDTNGNGRQDLGFGITQAGTRYRIQIGAMVNWDARGEDATAVAQIDQFITPRNA